MKERGPDLILAISIRGHHEACSSSRSPSPAHATRKWRNRGWTGLDWTRPLSIAKH